ncbi:MAG: hypothetical protein RL213_2012 [Bacteroidota bacterium]|jgi:predicted enzyme related to lactoylglutathione lyase
MNDPLKSRNESTGSTDNTPKVTGIGGIFFFSDNPAEVRKWYTDHLGMDISEWGATFVSRNNDRPEVTEQLQWSPFRRGSDYFAPSSKEFMINYRVRNIEALVENLRDNGVTVLDEITDSEYGKFVHVMDPEGNKLELWEPAASD